MTETEDLKAHAAEPLTGDAATAAFSYFTEVGIINQLSTAMLAQVLPDGVHPSHFSILNHLVLRGEGRTPISIAKAMQVTKNTMTHSLKVLEARDFIVVKPNPQDARGKCVFLTAQGRQFRETAIGAVVSRFGEVLGPDQLRLIQDTLPALREMRTHLDKARD